MRLITKEGQVFYPLLIKFENGYACFQKESGANIKVRIEDIHVIVIN